MDPTLLIGDIVERDSSESSRNPVEFRTPKATAAGFPRHRHRWRPKSDEANKARPASPPQAAASFDEAEKRRIDRENRQRLANMTPQEIAQAQQDIINGLNPGLVRRLLQRATIDDDPTPSPFDSQELPPEIRIELPENTSKVDALAHRPPTPENKTAKDPYDEDQAPAQVPADLFPITNLPKTTHFPAPPTLPDLDPSEPDFLATLHEKYFPNLPADPSKLAWMAPVPSKDSPADKESPYYPHPEISVSALRFDFRGRFLSPRVSRSIPSTKGLHHHGEAPEAAGYTIAELARLARSAVPAQRCMAYQTLGRILYRLGRGEWGKTEDDPIAMGVWSSIKQGRVLDSLFEAASGEGGHRGSRAYATEALWLFDKGGWKEKHKGR
ncbi:transcription factor Rba50 [Ophiocordyceps camponoti-floridani]|uniref:Transcription factor Rba50 n=1 Tax=Ophiocordyceps camponoti-floridani TaxID=2030778 RepID=A0A8H4Q861_9HYPO|nr:transcription factor Rba50 [Ophiocordyceps camponoti-floridani]